MMLANCRKDYGNLQPLSPARIHPFGACAPKWRGLADDDKWKIIDSTRPYDKRRLHELDFWFGGTTASAEAS
jgi:hypothetical protein